MSGALPAAVPPAGTAALLARLRPLPQLRLEPRAAVTAVIFRDRTVARLDADRERAEIAAPVGATVHLTSAAAVERAAALIGRAIDEGRYHWQLATANP